MGKIVFIEQNTTHFNDCKSSFMQGAAGYVQAEEVIALPNKETVTQLQEKPEMVIRCYANELMGMITTAQGLYPETQFVMPLKNQLFEDAGLFTSHLPPLIITGGSAIGSGDRNKTTYGNGLEFWDINPLSNTAAASFAVSLLAGKLYRIRKMLNCNWWEARYRAQVTALRGEPNRTTYFWDIYNGYGVIDVQKAVSYKGRIPVDPYISVFPKNAGNIKAICENGTVSIFTEALAGASIYKVYRDSVLIYSGDKCFATDSIAGRSNPYIYTYKAGSPDGSETALSEGVSVSNPLLGTLSTPRDLRYEGNLPASITDEVLFPFIHTASSEMKKYLSPELYTQLLNEQVITDRKKDCIKGEANIALSFAVHSLNTETSGNGFVKIKGWDESKSELLSRKEINDLSRYYRMTGLNLIQPYIGNETEVETVNMGKNSITII